MASILKTFERLLLTPTVQDKRKCRNDSNEESEKAFIYPLKSCEDDHEQGGENALEVK